LGVSSAAIWHEVECGGYAADLVVWERLAGGGRGRVLELGCGGGRVALHLARRGREVWGVDSNPALVEAIAAQAAAEQLGGRFVCADVRALELDCAFELIIAPMQLVQVLGGRDLRRAALERALAHLARRGRFAAAIVERSALEPDDAGAAVPDVRERAGWVYSSLPVSIVATGGELEIRRLRQAVSPQGSLTEEEHVERLDALDADQLEAEAQAVGWRPLERLEIPSAGGYLGATVVILERS
jgi:SAM-dependent methyltransferase